MQNESLANVPCQFCAEAALLLCRSIVEMATHFDFVGGNVFTAFVGTH